MRLLLGGYTSGGGIGAVTLDEGRLGTPVVVAEAANPTFLVVSADGRFMYAVLQDTDADEGAVGAWVVEEGQGPWAALGEQSTGGEGPCHLTLTPDGRFLAAANYESGSVSVHPVKGDGSVGGRSDLVLHAGPVGPVADRQDGPHAHQVVFGPSGHLFSCDLGLDAVIAYDLDSSTGRLDEVARCVVAPGTGPRHLAFAPDGSTAWVVGELASTVTVCAVDGPSLTPVATLSSRASGAQGENLAAEIVVSADGEGVFVSNRGDDTVAAFAVEGTSLRLESTADCGGHWPRFIGFGEDEDSLVVTNERSSSVVVLRREAEAWSVGDAADWPQPTVVAYLP